MKTVVFHAKRTKNDTQYNHTLGFALEGDSLLCTYAKNRKADSYRKKVGYKAVVNRLERMVKKTNENKLQIATIDRRRSLDRYMPGSVVSTMSYYARMAARALGVTDANPKMRILGQGVLWNVEKKPIIQTVVETDLNTITPEER